MRLKFLVPLAALLTAQTALAIERVEVVRIDSQRVKVTWSDSDPVTIMSLDRADARAAPRVLVRSQRGGEAVVVLPGDARRYLLLRDGGDGRQMIVAERQITLERGSNFRDLGGYAGAGGKRVRWGAIYRSGALPLLSDADYRLLGGLRIGTIIDLRSLEERAIAPTLLDDRTGALFVSNDYSIRPMLSRMGSQDGRPLYAGTEKTLAPQYRALFRRLLASDGALLFHCSAGQDRTGIGAALVLSALGVDRSVIIADYHLSTALRQPANEMPAIRAEDWPDNPMAQLYARGQAQPGGMKAEALFEPSGASHIVRFLDHIDRTYGSVDAYLARELGIGPHEIARLRAMYLEA
ncbi:MAG: tyrosine-protein phosphatase [Sphingomonadales bacterium]|nr:tyrosine-protein phosphatase [Sphingomonadales bacterium]